MPRGQNLTIATYPTYPATGNQGQVDYALFIGLQLAAIVEAKGGAQRLPLRTGLSGQGLPRKFHRGMRPIKLESQLIQNGQMI